MPISPFLAFFPIDFNAWAFFLVLRKLLSAMTFSLAIENFWSKESSVGLGFY
jgi:hypothetical protein